MKKLLTLFLSVILAFGAVGLIGCGKTETETAINKTETLSVRSVSVPIISGTLSYNHQTRSGQTGISKRVSATVTPSTALNKAVDYRLLWDSDAEKADESVSDYVVVEQDSDGSLSATVTCIQPFGSDVIILQVVTRDGGCSAECVLTYEGLISEMAITSSTLSLSNTEQRGDYYEVLTNNTYTFNVALDNELHNVGAHDLSVSVGGNGSFGLYTQTVYHTYNPLRPFQMWTENGWYAEGTKQDGDEDAIVYYYNVLDLSGMYRLNLFNIFDDPIYAPNANKFFTATLSGTTLTVTVNKAVSNYYEYVNESKRYNVIIGNDDLVLPSSANSFNTAHSEYYNTLPNNAQNLLSAYFTITVTDARTNISQTIKLWVESGIDSVALSEQTIIF